MKGAIEQAQTEFRRLEKDFPGSFDGPFGLGVIHILRDHRAFARDYLERARQSEPRDIRPYLLLAGVYRSLNDSDGLSGVLKEGWGRFPEDRRLARLQADYDYERGKFSSALKFYTLLHAAAPEDQDLRARMALANLHSGHHRRAADILGELRPENRVDYPLEMALARVAREQGRRQDANSKFEVLFNQNNARVEAGLSWADGLSEMGRYEEAQKLLDRLGQNLIPLNAELFQQPETFEISSVERLSILRFLAIRQHGGMATTQGRLAARRGNYHEAARYYRQALGLESDSYDGIVGMMDLSRRKGDEIDRLRWADRLVTAYKEHPLALLARAEVYLDLGRNPDAVVDAGIAAEAYPELSQAQAILSRAWLLLGKTEEALHTAERAVGLNGGDPKAHFSMAMALSKSGQARKAELSFVRALSLDPYWILPRIHFARFLTSQGRFEEANQQLTEAGRIEKQPGKRKL